MNAPVRWKDDASAADPALRDLLRHAGELGPAEAQLAALTERVVAQLPAPPPASPDGSTATASKTLPPALGAKLAAVVAGALLCAGGLWIALREPAADETRAERRSAPSAHHSEPHVLQEHAPTPSMTGVDAPEAAPVAATAQSSETQTTRPPTRARPPAIAVASQEPGDELTLLHEARRLRRADPAAALDVAREHERHYPEGTFREEREALIVELLLRSGQRAEGEVRLTAFLERYPLSAYATRIRGFAQRAAAAGTPDP